MCANIGVDPLASNKVGGVQSRKGWCCQQVSRGPALHCNNCQPQTKKQPRMVGMYHRVETPGAWVKPLAIMSHSPPQQPAQQGSPRYG